MSSQCGTLEISLFDNTNGIDTCVSCKAFGGAWIYCPVFNHILKDENVKFDETGEENRCELFAKAPCDDFRNRNKNDTVNITYPQSNDNWPYFICPACSMGNITREFQRCIDCGVGLKWAKVRIG